MYAKCCNLTSVANDYYVAKSDPKTTGTLLMTYNIVHISNTGRHTVRTYLTNTKFYINRRNGISTIEHSYRKYPCIFQCKNPFRTLKATINYNCHYTTMITRSHIVPTKSLGTISICHRHSLKHDCLLLEPFLQYNIRENRLAYN